MPVKFNNDNMVITSAADKSKLYDAFFDSTYTYINAANTSATNAEVITMPEYDKKLEELKARVEMLIELVTTLNEENVQLKDRVTILETLVANNENEVKKAYSATADWSKILHTVANGNVW